LLFAFLSDSLSVFALCYRILTLSYRQFCYHGFCVSSRSSSIRRRSISNKEVSSDLDLFVFVKGRVRRRRENGNISSEEGEADQRRPRSTQFTHPRWRHVPITAISARRRGDCSVADCVLFRVLQSVAKFSREMRDEAARASRQRRRAILEVSRWHGSDVHGSWNEDVRSTRTFISRGWGLHEVLIAIAIVILTFYTADVKSKDCANNSSREYSQTFRNILSVGFD